MEYLTERGCGQSGGRNESWVLSVNSIYGMYPPDATLLVGSYQRSKFAHLLPVIHPAQKTSSGRLFPPVLPVEFSFL